MRKRSKPFTDDQYPENPIKFLFPIEKLEFDSVMVSWSWQRKRYNFTEHDRFRSALSIIVRIK